MTRISMGQEPLLLSPPIPVEWLGFDSDTRRMQMCGWEFAVHQDVMGRGVDVLARHRTTGYLVTGFIPDGIVRRSAMVYQHGEFRGFNGPPIRFSRMTHENNTQFVHTSFDPNAMLRVDMNSEFSTIEEIRWSGAAIELFRKWAPQSEEIIVAPETVADLYERIRKLQDPELKNIRERNRMRDARERQHSEQVVAQIITLAA